MNFKNIALKSLHNINFNTNNLKFANSGINKVFIDYDNSIVVKIHKENNLENINNEINFSNFLKKNNFHSSEILSFKNKYIFKVNGFYITFWKFIEHNNENLNLFKLGKTINNFHKVTSNYEIENNHSIIKTIEFMINRDKKILNNDFIKEIELFFNDFKNKFLLIKSSLNGHISHGDLHIGNFLCTSDHIYIIDFELMSKIDSRIDLISVFFEDNLKKYNKFSQGYGWDVREWEHFDLFLNLQKIFSCVWLNAKYINNKSKKQEIELSRRISSIEENKNILFKSML